MNKYTRNTSFDDVKHLYKVCGVVLPSVTELCKPLTVSKYDVQQNVIDAAKYRGTHVHELTALYDMGDLEPDSVMATDDALYFKAWLDFCHDYQPEWLYIETMLSCRTFAGTVDRIGFIDNKLVIVDIKTTSSMDRASKVSLACQLYGYHLLCQANGIDTNYFASFGVQLTKEGTYNVIRMDKVRDKYLFDPAETFEQLQNIYNTARGYKSADE